MTNKKPTLLLHACCAPCFTSVYEQLKDDFNITVYWFNPNIYPIDEYEKRRVEILRYAEIIGVKVILENKYLENNFSWNKLTDKYPNEKEGGMRCQKCINYRLINTALFGEENRYDYFATTLTISPHKNSQMINTLGKNIQSKLQKIKFLDTDFKKNNGYLCSIELSKKYDLYRQNYCGCSYSINVK